MEKRDRPTICDGKVVTFAEGFEDKGPGIFGRNEDPTGPYEISASRNAVIIHSAEFRSAEDAEKCIEAIRAAVRESQHLTTQDWGGNFKRAPSGT